MSRFSIVAHRGASAYFPGNTLGAFDLAARQGAAYVECDVHLTRDEQVLVWHDWKTIYKETPSALCDLELDTARASILKSLEQSWGQLSLDNILTLPSFLEWLRASNVGALIEIKNGPMKYPSLPSMTARAIRDAGVSDRCILTSFDHVVVKHIKSEAPDLRTGILYIARLANLPETIAVTKASLIETHHDYLDRELVEAAHMLGCQVCSWAADDPDVISGLVAIGVDMITTNRPDLAKACLNKLESVEVSSKPRPAHS